MEICAHSQSEQQEDWGCICYIIHIFPETRLLNINCLKDTVVIINIMETWMKHELGCTPCLLPSFRNCPSATDSLKACVG